MELKGMEWKGNERKILRYAQNDNCNAVNAKESHNFPYLCRTPQPKPKAQSSKTAQTKTTPKKTKKQKH